MSGGSYDYLCFKMSDAANELSRKHQPSYRRAFGKLMKKCAEAMHEVEWVDSCDKSQGDDEASIMECINVTDILQVSIEEAKEHLLELTKLIQSAENDRV